MKQMANINIRSFIKSDLDAIKKLLQKLSWEENYIDGQINTILELNTKTAHFQMKCNSRYFLWIKFDYYWK